MKRGSSVFQPPSSAAKRHTHPAGSAHAQTHTSDDALSLTVSGTRADTHAAGSSPFPAATSLFSPDVSTKMASDLLIKLSEATQKAQMHPGSQEEAGPQDEPGVALSPDGPGASPEPPTLTHTPDGNSATDTLASDLLRKLAERQEVSNHVLILKEEEEPMEVDTLDQNPPITEDMARSTLRMASHHLFGVKTEDRGITGNVMDDQFHFGAKMADQCLLGLKVEDRFCAASCQTASKTAASAVSETDRFEFGVKAEGVSGARTGDHLLNGAGMEDQFPVQAKAAERPFSGAKMSNKLLSGGKVTAQVFSAANTDEQLFFGAKMEEQCLRAVLWQDMSVNLASTLLHQLSERVGKSSGQQVDRSTTLIRSSPVLKVNVDQLHASPPPSSQEPPHEIQKSPLRNQATSYSYFFRCHVCGFETEGQALFQSHMTEHRQWEQGSFSLHCCICNHSTNQESEMRTHVDTHIQGETGQMRCPVTLPAASSSAPAVAVATQPEKSTSEHRCRICQRSFPGQQELQVHFQGHRQGNQYRCDLCGHLTRTANKLVEHVRVHTGERPFTCELCPYSAKRRDSLRLHCKVKHAAHAKGGATDVHTHRSYAHGDNQRSSKHVQRLHTAASPPHPTLHPSLSDRAGWRDLSPLLPITTLISLKPRSPSSSSSSSSSCSSSSCSSFSSPSCSSFSSPSPSPSSSSSSLSTKHSFLGYLGLTASS